MLESITAKVYSKKKCMQQWLESRERANIRITFLFWKFCPKMRAFNHGDKMLKPKKYSDKISKAVSGRAFYGINSVPDLIYCDLVTCLSILKHGYKSQS